MFLIHNDYIRKHFSGNFTAVLPESGEFADPSSKNYKNDFARLEKALRIEKGTLKDRDDYKKALRAFEFLHKDEEERELLIDLSLGVGPYLCEESARWELFKKRLSSHSSHTQVQSSTQNPL